MTRHRTTRAWTRRLAIVFAAALVAAACGDDDDVASTGGNGSDGGEQLEDVTVTVVTHDSFNITEAVLEDFAAETGITIKVLRSGDAGAALNQAILTKDSPQGDVFFGVDNSLLSRALEEDLFIPYESPGLDAVDDVYELDDEHRVTPIDTGDVCLNYDKAALADAGLEPPTSLEDLTDEAYRGTLVVENPATSSPGLAFLLATIDEFGETGWQDYWRDLRANGVDIAAGWEEAYYGSFSGSADSSGDRPIVVSYATSPPAEVVFAEQELDDAPTGVVVDSCYRQIEFAGILAGTRHEEAAQAVIDFMISEPFQADIPLNMFVYPVIDVDLPPEFVEYGAVPEDPYLLDADAVARNRDEWIETWTEIVLR